VVKQNEEVEEMVLQAVIDFLHVLATATWIGGMIYINMVLMPSLAAIAPPERGKLMGAAGKRFSFFSWGSVLALLITGFLKTPTGMLFNVAEEYGAMLTLKHVAVLAMIAIGIFITVGILPKIAALAPKAQEPPAPGFLKAQNRLKQLAVTNMILGMVVLLCAVLLKV